MKEHLNINKKTGDLDGLWIINEQNTTGDIWERIDQIIGAYTQLHPIEMEAQVRSNAEIQKNLLNDYGAAKGRSIRFGVSMPISLMFKIEKLAPDMFTDEKLMNRFMKKFKGLTICKKV